MNATEISLRNFFFQNRAYWGLTAAWVSLRVITSIWAAVASSILPGLPLEQSISLWPTSFAFPAWLERVFLSPWLRWDAEWFLQIVTQGYHANDGTAQFHPLYPWLAAPLHRIGIHPLFSLLLVSSLASLLLTWVFNHLARLDLRPENALYSTMMFFLFPSAFILFAPYSEALFLLFSVATFIFIRQKKWWLAGIMACLASLTRQQGLFLGLPLSWELWITNQKDLRKLFRNWRDWLSLSMAPAGYSFWLVYRWWFLSDLKTNTSSLNSIIYSFIISPSASLVVDVQAFLWPWKALSIATTQLISKPDLDLAANLLFGAYFLVLLALSWKSLPTSYQIYVAAITLVSFSYYTGPVHPYMG